MMRNFEGLLEVVADNTRTIWAKLHLYQQSVIGLQDTLHSGDPASDVPAGSSRYDVRNTAQRHTQATP